MLLLEHLKTHLKLDLADTSEDALLNLYLDSAISTFEVESKKRFPEPGEPTVAVTTNGVTSAVFVDPTVLSAKEQQIARQWLLFTLGHWYENKQTVVVDVRAIAVEIPATARLLMNLVREPTI